MKNFVLKFLSSIIFFRSNEIDVIITLFFSLEDKQNITYKVARVLNHIYSIFLSITGFFRYFLKFVSVVKTLVLCLVLLFLQHNISGVVGTHSFLGPFLKHYMKNIFYII